MHQITQTFPHVRHSPVAADVLTISISASHLSTSGNTLCPEKVSSPVRLGAARMPLRRPSEPAPARPRVVRGEHAMNIAWHTSFVGPRPMT
jgi:hypothetical protein